jgi:nicotinate-nucleotide pyrophosphorylase (carboxylating)
MTSVELGLVRETLLAAIREDVGSGDVTSRVTVPVDVRATGRYTTKQELVVAGLPVVQEVVRLVDPGVHFHTFVHDGDSVKAGTVLAEIEGHARSILTAERLTLNLLQRMCGIATMTQEYVQRIEETDARVIDTRKTAPGLRILDKYAVRCGGGMNHRVGLFDGVLIKNNHLEFHETIRDAIDSARRDVGHLLKVEVEVREPNEVREAIDAGADLILLDNFTPEQTRQAVAICAGRVPLESSGGITLENILEFAQAGTNYISVGALTHSVRAADIHLRVTPVTPD